jgi:TPR repeat protein
MTEEELLRAAQAGEVEMMGKLGGLYCDQGRFPQAMEWFCRAAQLGDFPSAVLGGIMGPVLAARERELGQDLELAQQYRAQGQLCQSAAFLSDDMPEELRQQAVRLLTALTQGEGAADDPGLRQLLAQLKEKTT